MKSIITAFKEHKTFKHNRSWDVNALSFAKDFMTPPHYADTIEVLLCCDITGDIYIGGQKTTLGGKQVFYIPPRVVHSVFYKKNNGTARVLKINTEALKPVLDLEELLNRQGKSFYCLPTCVSCYKEIAEIADTFHSSDNPLAVYQSILRLFELLTERSDTSEPNIIEKTSGNHNLRKLILWTENNYLNKISLPQVADMMGYEKHYFCNKFKALTGISYMSYVNNLRIQHACRLLDNGSSVSAACFECGFENLSYFIQLFKKITGVTPKAYSGKLETSCTVL